MTCLVLLGSGTARALVPLTSEGGFLFDVFDLTLGYLSQGSDNAYDAAYSLRVDGVVVFDKTVFNSSGTGKLALAVGSVVSDTVNKVPVFNDLIFQTSLVVEIKLGTAASSTYYMAYDTY